MGYQSLADQVKHLAWVARFGDFIGEDFPILPEGYGVSLCSRVYFDGEGCGTLFHCCLGVSSIMRGVMMLLKCK